MRLEKSPVKYDLRKFRFSNRVVNGTVCLTGFSANTTITRLKQGWINSGIIKILCTIKILYIISKHSCKEPEVVASV